LNDLHLERNSNTRVQIRELRNVGDLGNRLKVTLWVVAVLRSRRGRNAFMSIAIRVLVARIPPKVDRLGAQLFADVNRNHVH